MFLAGRLLRAKVLAALLASGVLAACGGGGHSVNPQTANDSPYSLTHTVSFTNYPKTGVTSSFDISFVDSTAGQYYLADRNNSGVTVINTSTFAYELTA